ncbi:hypothetical protein Moror_2441 [Moniliophthora roreri MCA 2997]|uniref:Uncharacterized protein n=1 Tax=Moniliophthora roreri (strain MCA 2997) TaxID=1381753 RepID=V2WG02_MONRO|nr:hypothetical protein Moror_2441 [Moniliophthora roreri MCA 2997]
MESQVSAADKVKVWIWVFEVRSRAPRTLENRSYLPVELSLALVWCAAAIVTIWVTNNTCTYSPIPGKSRNPGSDGFNCKPPISILKSGEGIATAPSLKRRYLVRAARYTRGSTGSRHLQENPQDIRFLYNQQLEPSLFQSMTGLLIKRKNCCREGSTWQPHSGYCSQQSVHWHRAWKLASQPAWAFESRSCSKFQPCRKPSLRAIKIQMFFNSSGRFVMRSPSGPLMTQLDGSLSKAVISRWRRS